MTWRRHDQAGRPVGYGQTVDVKISDGDVFENQPAFLWNWGPYRPSVRDGVKITEYRVLDAPQGEA